MIRLLELLSLAVFFILIATAMITPSMTTFVWMLVIPVIPLLILVIGFGRWRQICPLAWFAKLFQNSTLVKKRFVTPWLIKNFYLLQFSLLLVAFSARHWLLNYEAFALMIFFIIVSLMALLTGLFFSGKTWCNYFCPVSFVEKVYSISNANRYHISSACNTCTACKVNCPDIDMENSYWKETKQAQKRQLFYAFPGLVFGFYWYFYLQSGSWESYFDGTWANYQGSIVNHLLDEGFFFFINIPLVLAVPLTLVFSSIFSWLAFTLLEKIVIQFRAGYSKEPQNIHHFIIVLSAYTAFNVFYAFAGAPSYAQSPIFYDIFRFSVVVMSTWLLLRELPREERFYFQERFARKILKKWQGEAPQTSNLKEIYYTYASQQKDHTAHLENYKETLLELLEDGILTIEENNILDKLRLQLNISDTEHLKVMQQIRQEHQEYYVDDEPISQEKLFQKRSYQKMLKNMLDQTQELDIKQLKHIRTQFNISEKEHEIILHGLVQNNDIIQKQINSKLHQLKTLANAYHSVPVDHSPEFQYWLFTYNTMRKGLALELQKLLSLLYHTDFIDQMFTLLVKPDINEIEPFKAALIELDAQYQEPLTDIFFLSATHEEESTRTQIEEGLLDAVCAGFDQVIAATLLFAYKKGYNTSALYIDTWTNYSNPMIAEIALAIKENNQTLTDVEKLSFLHSVPIFSKLSHDDLHMIVLAAKEEHFNQGDTIVAQGENGDALYIITEGNCHVFSQTNGISEDIATIAEGDMIGEIAVISQVNRVATVIANTRVEVLKLSGTSFTNILYNNPSMSIDIMRQITKRLLRE